MSTMKKLLGDKRYTGILLAIILGAIFIVISLGVMNLLSGVPWYLFSSALRIIFGVVILILIGKIYGKSPKELLAISNVKVAIISSIGFLLYFTYYLIDVCAGFKSFVGLSAGVFISKILLQQIATGFYEELNYRVLILEGYNYGKKSIGRKVAYASLSFVIFGLLHVVTGWNTYTFLQTGAIGFAFAVIYLNSGNIIIPMILHFVYDIFANLAGYIEWNGSELFNNVNSVFEVVIFVMFISSLVLLFKIDTEKSVVV